MIASQAIFTRYTSSTEMVAMREAIQGEVQEYSYQIRLIDPSYKTGSSGFIV